MIARLRSTVHPVGADHEGELGCSSVKLALCCRRSKPLAEEETKDDTPGAIELTRTKLAYVSERIQDFWRLDQEVKGKLIWHHRVFNWLIFTLHLANLAYLGVGSYLLFIYQRGWRDACGLEVIAYYTYDYRSKEFSKWYTGINAWLVLGFILTSKVGHYLLLGLIKACPCPLRRKLTWWQAARMGIFIECANPFLFGGLAAWRVLVTRDTECREHYQSHGMYLTLQAMIDAQLGFQLPAVLLLYVGILLACVGRRLHAGVEWMLDGCPDPVTRDTEYLEV